MLLRLEWKGVLIGKIWGFSSLIQPEQLHVNLFCILFEEDSMAKSLKTIGLKSVSFLSWIFAGL